MALLRAAQLALANGHPAFAVSDRENNVQVDVRREYYHDPFFPPYLYYGRRYGYPWPYYPHYHASRRVELAVEVVMTATLLDSMRDDAFDARETAARLQAKYPVKTAPVQAGSRPPG